MGNQIIKVDEIKIGDKVVTYSVKQSTRAKHVRLNISLDEGLVIIIPRNYKIEQVEEIIRKKEKWILQKLSHFNEVAESIEKTKEQGANVLRYLGKDYPIVMILDASSPITVSITDEKAYITLPEKKQDVLSKVIEAWYRLIAKEIFNQRVKTWATAMGVSYNKVFVKNQKTRWGSCSSQKNLNFNLRLVMAPVEIVDYVIIHELAHIIEMNHSKEFWKIVEEYCPEYKKHIAWLKINGTKLII